MAKTRNLFADFLSRLGSSLFKTLSRCEDKGVIPGASRFLKCSFLGLFIALIGTLSAQPSNKRINCYVPVDPGFELEDLLENVQIKDASVNPNPTNGADSVMVKADVQVLSSNEFNPVLAARLWIEQDSVDMRAADGEFDEQLEEIIGEISVEELKPDTYWVYVSATSSQGDVGTLGIPLVVSEADSTDENITDTTEISTEE